MSGRGAGPGAQSMVGYAAGLVVAVALGLLSLAVARTAHRPGPCIPARSR